MSCEFPFSHARLPRETKINGNILEHCFGEPVDNRSCDGRATARREPIAAGLFGFRQGQPRQGEVRYSSSLLWRDHQ